MAGVRIERGTKKRLRDSGTVALLVKDGDDELKVRAALCAFLGVLATLDHWTDPTDVPPYAAGPIDTPLGPFVIVDPKDLSASQKAAMADELVTQLEAAGVDDATVSSPGRCRTWDVSVGHPKEGLTSEMSWLWPPSCYLLAYPTRRWPGYGMEAVRDDWLAAGIAWLANLGLGERVLVYFGGGVEMWLDIDDLTSVALAANGHDRLLAIAGDPGSTAAALSLNPYSSGALCLGLGGDDLTAERADDAVQGFATMCSSLDELVYAVAGIDLNWSTIGNGRYQPWENQHRYGPDGSVRICPYHQIHNAQPWIDRIVLDADLWQILTTKHIDQLGSPPPQARQVAPTRWDLSFGSAQDWWPRDDPPPVLAKARQALSPLLIDRDDYATLRHWHQEAET